MASGSGRGCHWDGTQWREGALPPPCFRSRSRSPQGAYQAHYTLTQEDRIFLKSVLEFAGVTVKIQEAEHLAATALNPSCPKCKLQGKLCRICEKLGVMGALKKPEPVSAQPVGSQEDAYNAAAAHQYPPAEALPQVAQSEPQEPAVTGEQLQMLWLAAHGAAFPSSEEQQPGEPSEVPQDSNRSSGQDEWQQDPCGQKSSQWDIQAEANGGQNGACTSSAPSDFGMSSEELAQLAMQMGGGQPPPTTTPMGVPLPATTPMGVPLTSGKPVSADSKCPKCIKLGMLCKICEKLVITKAEVKATAGFDYSAPLPHIEQDLTGHIRFKVIPLDASQVRALIGKNGETIRNIRQRCPVTEVLIGHEKGEAHGILRLTGDIEAAEAVVKDRLLAKGCLSSTIPANQTINTKIRMVQTEFPVAEVMPSSKREGDRERDRERGQERERERRTYRSDRL